MISRPWALYSVVLLRRRRMQSARASRVTIRKAQPPMMVPIIRPVFGVEWVDEVFDVFDVLALVTIPMNGLVGVSDGVDVVLMFELVGLEVAESAESVELLVSTGEYRGVLELGNGGAMCMLLEVLIYHD